MSWITGLAGKAEDFLNKVDKSAATALSKEDHPVSQKPATTQESSYSPYFNPNNSKAPAARPHSLSPDTVEINITSSASVPSNLYKLDSGHNSRTAKRTTPVSTPSGSGSARQSPVRSSKKDKDEELFEFLNSVKDKPDIGSKRKPAYNSISVLNGKHSRESSSSSTTSTPTGSKTPEAPPPSISIMSDNVPFNNVNGLSDSTDQTPGSSSNASDDLHGNYATEPSSGYISNQEENGSETEHLSSLERENTLLQNEVTQLNQEMTSVLQRSREAQDELARVKRQYEQQSVQLSRNDQYIRELRSQETDITEALKAKDAQLAVLRVRLDESDDTLKNRAMIMEEIMHEKERILKDHTSASGVQGQALDTLREKLQEAESSLRKEQEARKKIQQESMDRQNTLESEKQHLSQELSSVQRKSHEEKVRCSEMAIQLKSSKSQIDAAKQELTEYKEKATRILQSKDKLIASLKEGSGMSFGESGVSAAELEEMRQERDMFREEVQRSQMTIESLRNEIGDLEIQLQQDSDAAQDQISTLEEQLTSEKERRDDGDQEISKQKAELRYAHEELIKQKTAFQSCVRNRDSEIERLRCQLTTRNMSTSSQTELENRLHSLTESLIQKQTRLESLSTEKNSLALQLERMERQYKEAESSAQRATSTAVNMSEEEEVRNRVPNFMRISPLDGDVARRVKGAANSIDRFSMKIGVFLRRYPIARIFIILYMALLHLWVSIVLLTYKPEIHGLDFQPRPPGVP